jgi:hypothetical protein
VISCIGASQSPPSMVGVLFQRYALLKDRKIIDNP